MPLPFSPGGGWRAVILPSVVSVPSGATLGEIAWGGSGLAARPSKKKEHI